MKRFIINKMAFICVLLLLCSCFSPKTIACAAENDTLETVRVGYYPLIGYYDKSEDGTLSGYGYDFLQLISGYVNIEYEYVGYDKTWSELLQMLDEGELDMLTSVQHTAEREEKFDYSESPVGYSEALLTTTVNEEQLSAGNYYTYENMRVGMMEGSSLNEKMFEFAEKHQFSFVPVYYATQQELEAALQERTEVDAIVNTSMNILGQERILERFGRSPYYVIVKKGNRELLDKINYALNSLNNDYPTWSGELHSKYYSINDTYLSLQPEEREYLEQLKGSGQKLEVLINPDMAPYSYFENQQAKGILVDYFNKICDLYGIKVHYMQVNTSDEYLQAVYNLKADIVLTTNYIRYEAEQWDYYLTRPFMEAQLCLVTQNGVTDVMNLENKKIAVVSGMSSVVQLGAAELQKAELVSYASSDACIQAIKNKKVYGALLYEHSAYQLLNEDWKNEIQIAEVISNSISFSFAIPKKENDYLYSLMEHGIASVSSSQLQSIVAPYVLDTGAAEKPIWLYVYHKPLLLVSLMAAAFFVVIALFLWLNKKHNEAHKARQKKAEYEATHDPLTKVYNRQGYDEFQNKYRADNRSFAYIQIDVDQFKTLNDTYGHAFGDEVLQVIARQLEETFRMDDYVFRLGGDEFAVLLTNCRNDVWESISYKQKLIHMKVNEILKKPIYVTISVGVSWSEKGFTEEMVALADAALYRVKKNGRAGCCVCGLNNQVLFEWKDDIKNEIEINPLTQSDTGSFRIEIPNGTPVLGRLTCNETSRNLMGFSETMTPEECFRTWFDRIDSASKQTITNTYLAMQEKGQAECTYLYNHPFRGKITVRSGGKAVKNKEDIILYGYHQCLQNTRVIKQ